MNEDWKVALGALLWGLLGGLAWLAFVIVTNGLHKGISWLRRTFAAKS